MKVARYLHIYRNTMALGEIRAMPRPAPNDGLDKFQRYREARKTNGMKLLRIWVPDPRAPGFREEAERQARLLRGKPEELESLDFIEAAADWSES